MILLDFLCRFRLGLPPGKRPVSVRALMSLALPWQSNLFPRVRRICVHDAQACAHRRIASARSSLVAMPVVRTSCDNLPERPDYVYEPFWL
jgi:hypothetical protein